MHLVTEPHNGSGGSTQGAAVRLAMNGLTRRDLGPALLAVAMVAATPAWADGKFVLISHAPDSDSWWNTIKNAIKQAGEDFGVTVDYRNPPNGDLSDMARIIEQAAARASTSTTYFSRTLL